MLTDVARIPIKEIVLFGFLPSPLKKMVYRMRGYRIGRGVSFGLGSVVIGKDVEIGENTSISFLTIIRGKKIRLGAHVQIGAMTFMDTPNLELGEGTKINEQVYVGGLQFPDSALIVGRNCQIMQMTFINPTRSITIGDDTGIGGDCLLFGHSSWLSKFEGYPVEFDSIEIGKSVSLAWRVFVLPGTQIGEGAVIGANSLVRGKVPPRCLAVGFPARVVSQAPQFPRDISGTEKSEILKEIVAEMMMFLGGSGFPCRLEKNIIEVQAVKRRWFFRSHKVWRCLVAHESIPGGGASGVDVVLSLSEVSRERREEISRNQQMWIDLEKKERSKFGNDLGEEIAQYLRRYGVRLSRM